MWIQVFNSHAKDGIPCLTVRLSNADGGRQTTRPAGRKQDIGTLNPPTSRTMNTISKPMLASKCERPDLLPFRVLATPKLDGIRCLKPGGKALTRSFKPISNRFAREWIEADLPDGLDGELMLRGGTFSETTSAIDARDGQPNFVFHVFYPKVVKLSHQPSGAKDAPRISKFIGFREAWDM